MFTAYIIDKAGFSLLCRLTGRDTAHIPERLLEDIDGDNAANALKKLCDVGYAHVSGEHIDIEKTMDFLVSSVLDTDDVTEENKGKRVIFRCKKLIIIVEEDRLSKKKCRIVPIKDEEMLKEYYEENSEKTCYDEEDGE